MWRASCTITATGTQDGQEAKHGEIMEILNVELPYPPSINHYWRHTGSGRSSRVYITKQGRHFKANVYGIVKALKSNYVSRARLAVLVVLYPRDRRRRDIDNSVKIIFDALNDAHVFADDEQIDFLTVRRSHCKPNGACHVIVREIIEP